MPKPDQKIRLLKEIPSLYQPGFVHEVGSEGVVVEPLAPNGAAWLIEVTVPDETLEGDAWYETIEVLPHEFEVIE